MGRTTLNRIAPQKQDPKTRESATLPSAAAGLAGAGAIQYGRNEVEQDFPADLEPTWNTTLEALRCFGIDSPTATLASTEGEIEFDDVVVRVERHPESFTRVIIRVGTFHTDDHQQSAENRTHRTEPIPLHPALPLSPTMAT